MELGRQEGIELDEDTVDEPMIHGLTQTVEDESVSEVPSGTLLGVGEDD